MDEQQEVGTAAAPDSQVTADAAFKAQQAEVEAAELAALNGTAPADKHADVKKLCNSVVDRIREIMYDGGKLQRVKIEDPGQLEEFWRLYDNFDRAAALYMEGAIPRDTQYEITEKDYGGGARVRFKQMKPGLTLMDAARDLFVFIALL